MTMLPVLRRSLLSPTLRSGFSRSTIAPLLLQSRRTVASTVSNRPASQTFEHAATNVREEAGNTAADLAKRIAGANATNVNMKQDDSKGFVGITSAIIKDVPKPAMVLGLAGGIPYLGASGTTVYLAHQAGLAASGALTKLDPGVALTVLDQALEFQVTYGAVMLSFLGAMHWGMEFAGYGGEQGYKRLALGAAPVLFAWSTLSMQPMTALTAQWLGFTALWWADAKATSSGWAPRWYSQYRFYLSILVGTCIIGSLAGTSYYGPVAGHGFLSHDLELTRQQRKELIPEGNQMVKGPIEAVMPKTAIGEPLADFITIRKKQPKEESEKKVDSTEEKK